MTQALQAPQFVAAWLNVILFPLALIVSILSYIRRKQDVGGWLMYFYYWIGAVLAVYLKDALQNYRVFLPSSKLDPGKHLALIVAVYPRLFALLGAVVAAVIVVKRREWFLIERLRMMLGVTVVIAGISVALDAIYFRRALMANLIRCVMLLVWLLYFYLSKRVHHVFRTKDWEKLGADQVLGGTDL
jgi:hypothetical protein